MLEKIFWRIYLTQEFPVILLCSFLCTAIIIALIFWGIKLRIDWKLTRTLEKLCSPVTHKELKMSDEKTNTPLDVLNAVLGTSTNIANPAGTASDLGKMLQAYGGLHANLHANLSRIKGFQAHQAQMMEDMKIAGAADQAVEMLVGQVDEQAPMFVQMALSGQMPPKSDQLGTSAAPAPETPAPEPVAETSAPTPEPVAPTATSAESSDSNEASVISADEAFKLMGSYQFVPGLFKSMGSEFVKESLGNLPRDLYERLLAAFRLKVAQTGGSSDESAKKIFQFLQSITPAQ